MSGRRVNPKPPTQRDKVRVIVSSLGVYTSQVDKLRKLLAEPNDRSIQGEEWQAILHLVTMSDRYAEALKDANKAVGRKS